MAPEKGAGGAKGCAGRTQQTRNPKPQLLRRSWRAGDLVFRIWGLRVEVAAVVRDFDLE